MPIENSMPWLGWVIALVLLAVAGLALRAYIRSWRERLTATDGTTDSTTCQTTTITIWGGWLWKSWIWIALFVLLLPILLHVVPFGVGLWWAGVVSATTSAPPHTTTSAKPWAKSVGGPLQWSAGAKVEQRARIVNERVDADGICFAGVMAPATWADKSFFAFHERTDWGAYLTDRTTIKTMPRSEFVQVHGTAEKKKGVAILHLPNLSARCEEILHLGNSTGKSASSAPVLSEHYLQLVGNGPRDITIETTRQTERVSEYAVDVDGEEITIILPREHWRWLWIVPVHHVCYQSRFLDTTVPSTGLSPEERTNAILASDPELQKRVDWSGEGYREDMRFQSILINRNGETTILAKALLLRQTELTSRSISVRLNIPNNKIFPRLIRPARIIIGIQQ